MINRRLLHTSFDIVFLSASLLNGLTAISQAAVTKPPKPLSHKTTLEIKDTKRFFEWFYRQSQVPERNQFETEKEYKKRLSPLFNSKKVIYFTVAPDPLDSLMESNYKYDIEGRRLTMFAGEGRVIKDFIGEVPQQLGEGTPIMILEEKQDKGSYAATNAFGASVMVRKTFYIDYILNFLNADKFPTGVLSDGSKLTLTVTLPPEEAKKLSKRLDIVVGVTLPGYEHSASIVALTVEPTVDKPTELAYFQYVLDAKLVTVLLRDRTTGRIMLERPTSQ